MTGRPPIRPTVADAEAVARLCDRLVSGMSMAEATKEQDVPSRNDVYLAMAKDDAFRTVIARAREAQQDAVADEVVDLADLATAEDWQVVKMRIWARQWRASKLAPKKYGDKLDVDATVNGGLTLRWAKDGEPTSDA